MNVGIVTEAALFPEKEYIMDISFAVYVVSYLNFVCVSVIPSLCSYLF